MSPVEVYIVAITHVLAWPSIRYWMVYRKVKWKDGATGRALFNKARSLALLVVISLIAYWWPWGFFQYVYAATLTYLTGAVWYQYRVMRQLVAQSDIDRRLAPYTLKGTDHEATQAVRPDDPRREARGLADEGRPAEG